MLFCGKCGILYLNMMGVLLLRSVIAIFLCLILCCFDVSNAETYDISGYWVLDRMTMLGMDFGTEDLGFEMNIWFGPDEKGILIVKDTEGEPEERDILYEVVYSERSVEQVVLFAVEEDASERVVLYVLYLSDMGELYANNGETTMWFIRWQEEVTK